MVFDVREGQAQAQTLTEMVENGETPSLEQVAEFQRLSLKRTELALELLAIFKRVNISQEINPEMQEILMKVSGHLEDADEQLGKIAQHFQKAQSPSE